MQKEKLILFLIIILSPLILIGNPLMAVTSKPSVKNSVKSSLEQFCFVPQPSINNLSFRPDMKNLLVMVAMEVEEKGILSHFKSSMVQDVLLSETFNLKGKKIIAGDLNIYIVQTGVGQVSAASNATLIMENNPIDAILLLGVAGALRGEIQIGDVVIGQKILQHDSVYSGEDGFEIMAPGKLYVSILEKERSDPFLSTDSRFSTFIGSLLHKDKARNIYEGTIMSGNEFVANPDRKRSIAELDARALAVEMEAVGIALVAKQLDIPFAVVKTIADRLNPDGSITSDYNTFVNYAAQNAGRVVKLIVEDHNSRNSRKSRGTKNNSSE